MTVCVGEQAAGWELAAVVLVHAAIRLAQENKHTACPLQYCRIHSYESYATNKPAGCQELPAGAAERQLPPAAAAAAVGTRPPGGLGVEGGSHRRACDQNAHREASTVSLEAP